MLLLTFKEREKENYVRDRKNIISLSTKQKKGGYNIFIHFSPSSATHRQQPLRGRHPEPQSLARGGAAITTRLMRQCQSPPRTKEEEEEENEHMLIFDTIGGGANLSRVSRILYK
tara:strand:+ start:231 stop:575 length:345 start_codon:yes stop_codon:yes gene_type:complete